MSHLDPVLAGTRILLTAQRRADDLAAALVRRGAEVTVASTLGVESHIDEATLIAQTRELIADPPDVVAVTTGIGLRGWLETADAAGLGPDLIGVLRDCRVVARGPKAVGALLSVGVTPDWVAESETSREILEALTDDGVAGDRIAVQLHGAGDYGLSDGLRAAGADVTQLVVYRWGAPPDPEAVTRSVLDAREGRLDAVAFTSLPGAAAWVAAVDAQGARDEIARRSGRDLLLACVGTMTAEPLEHAGFDTAICERARLGSLVRLIVTRLGTDGPVLHTAVGELRIRACEATLDHRVLPLSAGGLAVLRLLAADPGVVFSREQLLRVLPGDSNDPHAAEVAVARLREALGDDACLVKTVFRRGYRLLAADDEPRGTRP